MTVHTHLLELGDNAALDAKVVATDQARAQKPPDFSEEALALQFADQHADGLRYVAKWNKWLRWDGTRWQFDDTLFAFDRARELCRRIAAQAIAAQANGGRGQVIASHKTVAAVVALARADRRIAATVDQWDSDPWVLNTPDGVVDLLRAEMRPHQPTDYLTKVTGIAPDFDMPTPLWNKFLVRVTNEDPALIAYLQRMAGYALTGLTREHALFFFYGTGANGKTTFLNAISGVAGEYHRVAPIETFTESKTDRHPTDLAGLIGARLVTAVETDEGRHWAESKIKTLTGGDKISAHFMRQDYFDYVPQFKLFVAGNHKPRLRRVDEAIRRRLNIIPFTVTIPPQERDHQLEQKLKGEWPGILAWAINGCCDWQELGLAPPPSVMSATAAYLEAEDVFGAWIDECCEQDARAWQRSQELFESWKAWAERAGEREGTLKDFKDRIGAKGGVEYHLEPGTRRAGYRGIRLRRDG